MMPVAFYEPPRLQIPAKAPTPVPQPVVRAPANLTPLPNLLRQSTDLQKLPLIRKKLIKERHALSTTLNAGVSSQLTATREGLRNLVEVRDEVTRLRDRLKALDRGQGPGDAAALERIAQVSKIARQIAQTVEIVQQLREMTNTVSRVAELFARDTAVPYGPCHGLLEVHAQLMRMTGFRAEALHDAQSADREVLLEMFKPLDELNTRFEEWIFGVAGEVVEWVRRGRGGVVVRVFKIVEVEGKEDEKVRLRGIVDDRTLTLVGRRNPPCPSRCWRRQPTIFASHRPDH